MTNEEEYAETIIENFQEEELEKEIKKQKKRGFRMSLNVGGFGRKRAGTIMDPSMGMEEAAANRNKSMIGVPEEDGEEGFHEEAEAMLHS